MMRILNHFRVADGIVLSTSTGRAKIQSIGDRVVHRIVPSRQEATRPTANPGSGWSSVRAR